MLTLTLELTKTMFNPFLTNPLFISYPFPSVFVFGFGWVIKKTPPSKLFTCQRSVTPNLERH